jgi:hypothetical protein
MLAEPGFSPLTTIILSDDDTAATAPLELVTLSGVLKELLADRVPDSPTGRAREAGSRVMRGLTVTVRLTTPAPSSIETMACPTDLDVRLTFPRPSEAETTLPSELLCVALPWI